MKLQDIGFFFLFLILLVIRKPKLFVILGMLLILLSIPLFASWVFFTAERMVWYGAACFLSAALVYFFKKPVDH